MQKWNIQTDRAQKVDEKKGIFVLCLLLELWSLKCQKWLIYCRFCWCQQKISHSLEKIHSVHWGIMPPEHPPLLVLFLAKPPLNQHTVQAPFLGNPTSTLVFHEAPHKSQIFQRTPKIIKFFILNTILSFNSN